jgi:hypothetical protein
MSAMLKQLGLSFGLLCLLTAGGCAKGVPAAPDMDIEPYVPPPPVLCGNMKLDMGEQCDCPNALASTQCLLPEMSPLTALTCGMVKPGSTGMLLCNAKLCTIDMSMCVGGVGAAGIGASGRGAAGAAGGTGGTGSMGRGNTAGTGR